MTTTAARRGGTTARRWTTTANPAPVKPVKGSTAYRRGLWVEYARVLLACAVAVAVLLAMIVFVAADGSAEPLWGWIQKAGLVAAIWLVAGPVWGMFEQAPRQPAGDSPSSSSAGPSSPRAWPPSPGAWPSSSSSA